MPRRGALVGLEQPADRHGGGEDEQHRGHPEDDPHRPFEEDQWELYNVAEDFSESRDLAAEDPVKLRELQDLWWSEAGRFGVLPLSALRVFAHDRPAPVRVRDRYVLRPGAAPVPEEAAPNTKLRPHTIVASVDVHTMQALVP